MANSPPETRAAAHKTMAKIKEDIEQKIKDAANILDVMEDLGVSLHKSGVEYTGLCPFHKGTKFGNFKVNPRKNIATCFGDCCRSWTPIDALMEGANMTYPEALRHLAATYNIYIDEEPAPKVKRVCKPRPPMPAETTKKWIVWDLVANKDTLIKPYMHHPESNALLTWLLNLPMSAEHKRNLRNMIELYLVGTSLNGYTKGWVMWPQVDMNLKIRDIKLMAYHQDGHRDKAWNPNWMSAMLAKAGKLDKEIYDVHRCLFGLHLAKIYPDAEVCLVESEKTAVICSAFSDPRKKIWMACGGLQFFKPEMVSDLVAANRYIVVYPDIDGKDKWQKVIEDINYPRMSMTDRMQPIGHGKGIYNPALDGPKADIADIMVRIISNPETHQSVTEVMTETEAEKIARQLGKPEKAEDIQYLMDKLDLVRV